MSFPFFIAQRFFRNIGADKKSASNPTITIATAGVAVGLAVMVITVCVILGFKREVSSKVSGFASDIEVLDYRAITSPEGFPITADSAYLADVKKWPGVVRADRIAQKMGILKTETDFQGVTLKGLPVAYDTTFIANAVEEGRLPRLNAEPDPETGATGSNEIMVSRRQADDLGLKVGDRVFAYFFEETIHMRRFKICGIYCTNLGIFDNNVLITDFETVSQLNNWNADQCSSVEVRLTNLDHLDQSMDVADRYNAEHPDPTAVPRRALSVKDHFGQIFAWLDLLDFNMYVILILMICVAGFTMISGLLILILEHTQTIGVLKALGATNGKIRRIFLNFAGFITLRGLLIGDVLALGLIFVQKQFGFIHLDPSSYYVDTVPVEINWWAILLLNVATLILTTLALIAPSYVISRIQPAKAIRYE